MRPPRPLPRTVTVVSPPESSTQGARTGWPCARPTRDAGHDLADFARLAFDRVAEDQRGHPGCTRHGRGRLQRSCGAAIMMVATPASRGSPGFGVSSRAAARWARTDAGGSMP